jgi:hypothetical protein
MKATLASDSTRSIDEPRTKLTSSTAAFIIRLTAKDKNVLMLRTGTTYI